MLCPETLRVQAYFDDEVDALAAVQIERHLEHCAECGALHRELKGLRTAMRDLPRGSTPPGLQRRILRALDAEGAATRRVSRTSVGRDRPGASFWMGAASGVGGTAIAASLAFFLFAAPLRTPLLDELLNAQVRSLMPEHLIDVVSTDKHTVKPWFAGHADVSPVVADFETEGYRLIGGRADYLDRQRAAVVVYQHGAHIINVFTWAADAGGVPHDTTRNGYRLAFWQVGNLVYCAVSDTGWDELLELERLLRR